MNKQLLSINVILNILKTSLGIIFPLITFPYISRVLGVEKIGIYNFSASFVSYFLLLSALGISIYGIREGIQYRDNNKKISYFISQIFSINIISTLISFILLILSLLLMPFLNKYAITILILSLEMFFTTLGVSWVCNIYEDFLFITIRTMTMQVISLILTFTLVKSIDDFYKYIIIIVLANSGANILNFFYIRKHYCHFYFTLKIEWKQHIKPILIIFSTTVAITVYVNSDITMLGFVTSDYYVGLYSTSVKIYTIIKNVLAAFLMVLIPQFSLLFSKGNKKDISVFFSKVFNMLTLLIIPMSLGLFILSDDIVVLISGKEYIAASKSLRLLSIAIIFSLYSYMYTQCVLIPLKKESIVFKITLISAIINIFLNFILIPLWGINATALTTIIAEILTFVISYIESKKYIQLIDINKNLFSVMLGCVSISIVCFFARSINNYIIRISISIIISIVVYLLILIITKNNILNEIQSLLKKYL